MSCWIKKDFHHLVRILGSSEDHKEWDPGCCVVHKLLERFINHAANHITSHDDQEVKSDIWPRFCIFNTLGLLKEDGDRAYLKKGYFYTTCLECNVSFDPHKKEAHALGVTGKKNFVFCFSCQSGGGSQSLVARIKGIGMLEANEWLKKKCSHILSEQEECLHEAECLLNYKILVLEKQLQEPDGTF